MPVENSSDPLRVSPWPADRHQVSERERQLEALVYLLLNHTSHTDLQSPISECRLCGKVGGLRNVRIFMLYLSLYLQP